MVRTLPRSVTKLLVAVLAVACVAAASATASPLVKSDSGVSVKSHGNTLLFNDQSKFILIAEADAYCPTQGAVALYKRLDIDIFETYMSGCPYEDLNVPAPQRPPASVRKEHLDALLDGLGYWERSPEENQQLQGLPELVEWDARVRVITNPASLDVCSRNSTQALAAAIAKASDDGPVIYHINMHSSSSTRNCLNPSRFRNVFWTVWVSGGDGMMMSFQSGPAPGDEVVVDGQVQSSVASEARTMNKLAACLSRGKSKRVSTDSRHVATRACTSASGSYVVAVNLANTSNRTTINTTHGKKVRVIREGRSVKYVKSNSFSDNFGPLAVHIYKTS